jgi:hypothetical protein
MSTIVRIRPPTPLDGLFLRRIVFPHLLAYARDEQSRVAFYIHGNAPYSCTLDLAESVVIDGVDVDSHIALGLPEDALMSLLSARRAVRDVLADIVVVGRASSFQRFAMFLRRASIVMPVQRAPVDGGAVVTTSATVAERRRTLALYLALENLAAFLTRLSSYASAIAAEDARVRLDHGEAWVTTDDGECFAGAAAVLDA